MCMVQGWRSCLAYPWLTSLIPPGSRTIRLLSPVELYLFPFIRDE